ncbi:hypothetical protein M094_1926 [Bacteroides uniformis str. 3978 T3 ii]|uniref:Uncharacterized protein n=1 Tax=Bacteroides uniformis str. 3978 T3 ii TaxID=1339349 RepID=A0A078RZU1_BACUN|nr:hypothetical protein M094_1926 [Bacteroides uniformis str. 3978 T3 ii]
MFFYYSRNGGQMIPERGSGVRKSVPEAKKIKKSRRAANRTRGVTGRHPFSPPGDNYGW